MANVEGELDRDIIDITAYLGHPPEEGGGAFAIWGGEGERARFALPVWRALFLLSAERGGIMRVPSEETGGARPFFVLDLGEDPPRTGFSEEVLSTVGLRADPPTLATNDRGDVAVFLGEESGERWFLQVAGRGDSVSLEGKRREDLLFLAGECAGLLFLRDLARGED